MFTGIIEEIGRVTALLASAPARLSIEAPLVSQGARLGDSISVNGVCLTVAASSGNILTFDVVAETLARTTIGSLRAQHPVNLERAVSAERLLGGHFVLGHVDGVGTIAGLAAGTGGTLLTVRAPVELMRYVVPKGSVAVDGVSLTVASCDRETFTVALIPHTLERTTLGARRAGDSVNIETDILGKYVERLLGAAQEPDGITKKQLADAGWLEE
jgi:riboflavin synthase